MMKSKRKFKNTMKQMTMKTQLQTTKISGFSKSSPKRKIHSNTGLPQKKKKKEKEIKKEKASNLPLKIIRKRTDKT